MTERNEFPGAIGDGGVAAEDVEVAIVGVDLEEQVLGAIPLVDNFVDDVLVIAHAEAYGALTFFMAGVAVDVEFHGDIVRRIER